MTTGVVGCHEVCFPRMNLVLCCLKSSMAYRPDLQLLSTSTCHHHFIYIHIDMCTNQTPRDKHLFSKVLSKLRHHAVAESQTENPTVLRHIFRFRSLIRFLVLVCVGPDDANVVSESTEIVDVSPSITTNVIGQKADEADADMCERSCEELSAMFQELNGLRVVVSNLIEGLQKVVSVNKRSAG